MSAHRRAVAGLLFLMVAGCGGDGGGGAAGYRVATVEPTPRASTGFPDIALAGELAYVSTVDAGQLIVLSDPARPTVRSSVYARSWHGLVVDADQVIVADDVGISWYDTSTPAAGIGPRFALDGGGAARVQYLLDGGDIFLVRDPGFGIHAIDRATGRMRSGCRLPIPTGNPLRTMALGPTGILYVAGGPAGVQLVDAGDPDAIHRIGAVVQGRDVLGVEDDVTDLVLDGDRLIVVNNGIVLIYDVTTPAAPTLTARSSNRGGFGDDLGGRIAVYGDHALLVGGHRGFNTTEEIVVVDLAAPDLPVLGRLEVPWPVDVITSDGERIVASGPEATVLVIEEAP